MNEYLMRTQDSCGPDELAAMAELPHEVVDKAWGIDKIGLFKNVGDTPYNHFAAMKKLNIPWKIRNCSEIITGKCTPGKTAVLVHSTNHPLLLQHWVILSSVSADGTVFLHWGDGSIKGFKSAIFQQLYSGGKNIGPQCAYEIGIGSTSLTWYQRAYAWITGKFI